MTRIQTRPCAPADTETLIRHGLHPVLARLYAARGIRAAPDVETGLDKLLPPHLLRGIDAAAARLADAIAARRRLLVIADYDCDGATACAVAVRGLRMLGADVDYLVPNRFEYGYGLTPEIVALALSNTRRPPELLITVDNGIASVEGVAAANAAGVDVVVTDHHLPGDTLPDACAIVNPNQPDCTFPSKHIAGVGVIFYVLLATRAAMRARGVFDAASQPKLVRLLDLVALGTVADVVRLDPNNRVLVAQGLARIRAGKTQPGIAALFRAAGREARTAGVQDLGFAVGPRLNAAGRLADMSLGIECLLTDDPGRAWELAQELDGMNRERREIETGMQHEALAALDSIDPSDPGRTTLTLYDPLWHQGVIGIVASRLKERFYRPTITFAPADDDGELIKGSGRSIPGFHLRDALDLVSKRHPGMLLKFGGHAMAAGLTLRADDFARFTEALETVGREWLPEQALQRVLETDGELEDAYFTAQVVEMLDAAIWGQGFPAPVFSGVFEVRAQSLVKDRHLKLQLFRGTRRFDAIWFNRTEPLPEQASVAYRLTRDTWNGVTRVQMIVEHAHA
ncbi:single-stranded-DNA-specific exonuclease RecJ [Robbsia sp. Bb-Pol-6]|uniref:Single-stranded-DNA-specific exonuclease RecJ n=1 Tax=Robbsia betulipollinis TaxID=2981849 RepID=A0ABT3ZMW7_9BURK|nr:single-stranded-DNA-specific exonuclease RecJ [Robbsia betulipollinis]MCY0387865.1 single-stranded-DNA-specific exonuclease RecJ [Robbsia betulipollinis]